MTITEYLLQWLVEYGLPVLFFVILGASIGAPLPATLMLLTAGSFVEQGELNIWWVGGITTTAAVLGDQIGYGVGRWGSQKLVNRLSRWGGGADRLQQAQAVAARWGGVGVFLTRWLMTPLGPIVNLSSGIARYSWPAFFCFDVTGELLWVTLYVTLGRVFSNQVQNLSSVLGNMSWVIVGLVTITILTRTLLRQYRKSVVEEHVQTVQSHEQTG